MSYKTKKHDYVSQPLSTRAPIVRNQVGDIASMSDSRGRPLWLIHREDMEHRLHAANGLRWVTHDAEELAMLKDLFYGLQGRREQEYWYLLCYRTMRQRGLWPINIAVEQRLSDEHWMVMTPPTPAAIQ